MSQTRTVVSAASAAILAMPSWKLPVTVVVMRRLALSQKTREQPGWRVPAPW